MQMGKRDSKNVIFICPNIFLVEETVSFPNLPSLSFSLLVPFHPFLCFI